MKKLSKWMWLSALAYSATTVSAFADWSLQNNQSSVHFISTKKQNIDEIHHFKQLSAELSDSGKFKLSIDLASVETGIEIRNTRMREQLFKVGTFPTADVTAQLSKKIMQLKAGQSIQAEVAAELTLMETSMPLTLHMQISKTTGNEYVATSIQPILISATKFGLQQGVETLQKLAGLPSIGLTVPVSFNLLLKAD